MIEDTKSTVSFDEAEFHSPPPAFFDEAASANAQPVQPIPKGGVAGWVQRSRDARPLLNARTKALALVVVGGLAFGTLGGTMLFKDEHSSPNAAPVEIAETTEAQAEPQNVVPSAETVAMDTLADALQRSGPASSNRRHRVRPRVQQPRRAYMVDAIR